MDIVVYGVGAIGSVIATFLQLNNQKKEHNIALVGRESLMNQIAKQGLTYTPYNTTSEKDWIHTTGFQTYTSIAQVDHADLIFFTMKSHTLEKSLQDAKDLIARDQPIVVLTMNGLGLKEIVANYISPSRIIETIANYPSKIDGNKVSNTGGNSVVIAEDKEISHQILLPLMKNSLLNFSIDPKFRLWQWKKFLMNVGMNAVASISLLTIEEVLKRETLFKIQQQLIQETIVIAEKEGVVFDEDMVQFFLKTAGKDPHHRTSTQQDVINHKTTEIDFFNGYIVKKGKEYHIPTPTNEAILNLMHIIEGKY
jgi:2-dehydropantoate 2-reductase